MEFEKEIVKDLGNFQKLIDLGNSLDRLKNNADFNRVITQGYLHDLVLDLLFKHNGDNNSDYYIARYYLTDYRKDDLPSPYRPYSFSHSR